MLRSDYLPLIFPHKIGIHEILPFFFAIMRSDFVKKKSLDYIDPDTSLLANQFHDKKKKLLVILLCSYEQTLFIIEKFVQR